LDKREFASLDYSIVIINNSSKNINWFWRAQLGSFERALEFTLAYFRPWPIIDESTYTRSLPKVRPRRFAAHSSFRLSIPPKSLRDLIGFPAPSLYEIWSGITLVDAKHSTPSTYRQKSLTLVNRPIATACWRPRIALRPPGILFSIPGESRDLLYCKPPSEKRYKLGQ